MNHEQLKNESAAVSCLVEQRAILAAIAFRAIYLEFSKAEMEVPATIIAQMALSTIESTYETAMRSHSPEKSEVADA